MKTNLKKYKSRIGIVVPLIYLFVVAALLVVWLVPFDDEGNLFRILATCALGFVFFIFTWALFSTYYVLKENCLICVSGPFKIRVRYVDITDITEGFSLLSSFALSGRRVFINRGRNILRRVDISPKESEKEEFINELSIKIKNSKEQI